MGFIKTLFFIITAIILITFCAVNSSSVSINLFPLPYFIDIPIFIFAILCMMIGVITGSFAANVKLLKANHVLRKAQRHAKTVEDENKVMRSEHEYTYLALEKQS